jgi:hypothetical protein
VDGVPVEEGEWAIVGGTGEFKIWQPVSSTREEARAEQQRRHYTTDSPRVLSRAGEWSIEKQLIIDRSVYTF